MRTVSLTPNGTFTDYVFYFILHHLIRVAHFPFSFIYCEGKRFVVYVDVTMFVDDYRRSSAVIDCISHTANNQCTHCSFRILDGPDAKFKSVYAHNCTNHIANAIFARGWTKTLLFANRTLQMVIITLSE